MKGSFASSLTAALVFGFATCCLGQEALVPALIIFGDSSADVGNNDNLLTLFKANYPPYGRDFPNQDATGRFCNGKLALDFTAETLGFTNFPPAYFSPHASGKNLLTGVNFASAASGYDDQTALLNNVISLSQQMVNFRDYKDKLATVTDANTSNSIITGSIYVLSTGSSDFILNYYVNPVLFKRFTPDEYGSYLLGQFTSFVQALYEAGGRRLGVTNLPPLGCVPAVRNLFGFGMEGCVSRINSDARSFNRQINSTVQSLQAQFPDLKIALFDIFTPFEDLVTNPSKNGFFESSRGCCGTGTIETTRFLCNPFSRGTCSNASGYVFWDSVHPTESANKFLADSLVFQGLSLI